MSLTIGCANSAATRVGAVDKLGGEYGNASTLLAAGGGRTHSPNRLVPPRNPGGRGDTTGHYFFLNFGGSSPGKWVHS